MPNAGVAAATLPKTLELLGVPKVGATACDGCCPPNGLGVELVVAGAPNAPKTVLDVALEPPNAEKQFQEDLLFNIAICKQCKFELNQTQNQVLRNVFIFFLHTSSPKAAPEH